MQNREQSVKREDTEISVVLTPKNIPPWWLYTRSGFLLCSFLFAISETDHVRLEPSEGEHQRSNKTSQLQLQQIRSYILQSYTAPMSQLPVSIINKCDMWHCAPPRAGRMGRCRLRCTVCWSVMGGGERWGGGCAGLLAASPQSLIVKLWNVLDCK